MSIASLPNSLATVGILGGMGPVAGLDLCQKIVEQRHALRDQDHIPFVLYSVPQIPGRSEAILQHGDSPLAAMIDGIHALSRSGATCVAIACITAHAWLAELRAQSTLPILDIVDAVVGKLEVSAPKRIGLLATAATHQADIFGSRLEALGYQFTKAHDPAAHQRAVSEGIRMTKEGHAREGGEILSGAMEALLKAGAQRIILGCTEIPVALSACEAPHLQLALDATVALAHSCIDWSLSHK